MHWTRFWGACNVYLLCCWQWCLRMEWDVIGEMSVMGPVQCRLGVALASSDGPCCDCDSRTCQPVMFKHVASGLTTTEVLLMAVTAALRRAQTADKEMNRHQFHQDLSKRVGFWSIGQWTTQHYIFVLLFVSSDSSIRDHEIHTIKYHTRNTGSVDIYNDITCKMALVPLKYHCDIPIPAPSFNFGWFKV